MPDDSRQPLATGLIYEESLPLGFTVVESLPADWEIEDINNSNESFLRHCASLEEHACAKQDIDDSMLELYHELTRLDLKMNLLLEFVAQVLNRKLTLPNRVAMRLGPQGLEWRCSAPPPRDSIVKLDLFLFPRYPRSVVLFGNVVNVNAKDDPSAVTVAFRGLSESAQDWIEKIIFRYHRRSVANRRMAHT